MLRPVFVIAFAGLILAAVSGTAPAALIAPPPAGMTAPPQRFDGCVLASLLARSLGTLALPSLLAR
jgi:hypothetical protein